MRPSLRLVPAAALAVTVAALAACAADADDSMQPGKAIARSNGCLACHGSDGEGGTGLPWRGLYGSEITLNDGTTVIADEAYLRRAIVDPMAEVPEGVTLPMPVNSALSAADIDKIIAYIISLTG